MYWYTRKFSIHFHRVVWAVRWLRQQKQKSDVIEFFDRCAPAWDDEIIKNDHIVNTILDYTEITEKMHVLDVACGCGLQCFSAFYKSTEPDQNTVIGIKGRR